MTIGTVSSPQEIRSAEKGYSRTATKIGGTHQLLSGARRRDTIAVKRTWVLTWKHLSPAELAVLDGAFRETDPIFFTEYTGAPLVEVTFDDMPETVPISGWSYNVTATLLEV